MMTDRTAGGVESRVCMLPVVGEISPESLAGAIDNILNFRAYRLLRIFAHEEVVGVKPCQNRAEHSLDYVASVVTMLRHRGVTPMVCDTTDRYRDINRNAIKRMEELSAHFASPNIPIVMLSEQEQDLASQLLAQAETAGIGRRRYFVERVAF